MLSRRRGPQLLDSGDDLLSIQVRAGEGESEHDGYVLTNPVAKTSMSSGLSKRGTVQARHCCVHPFCEG